MSGNHGQTFGQGVMGLDERDNFGGGMRAARVTYFIL